MKTSSLPTIAWTRILGTSVTAENISLTTGLDGSIYVSGSTNVSLDGQTISGGWDTYITKYTPDGIKVWTRLLGSSSTDLSYAMTTGLDGSIYVGGRTQSWLDGQVNNGGNDAFITKYSPDGTKVWTRLLGTNGEEYVVSLNTGLDGSIYLGGSTTGSLEGQVNNGISSFDAYITKFTADGVKVWTRLMGSRVDQYARATTTSQDGSIYISGDTWGSMDGQSYMGGESDVFITKYTPDGIKVWTRLLGSSSGDYACAMTSGLDGSIFVCGFSTGSLNGQSNTGGLDAFVSKYNPDGIQVWTRMIGTESSDRANAITIDLEGSVYVSGWTTGSLDGQAFGGNTDAFVTKYDPDGAKIWTRLFGSSSSESSTALTKGTDGSIYLGGWTTDSVDGLQKIKGGSDAFIIKLVSTSNPTPTIAISSNNLTLKAGETALITFTLSDVSSNFNSSDVNCIGGVLSNFSGSGTTYTAIFIPSASSIISGTIKVASAVFTDEAGNLNADGSDANNTITIAVDTATPTITLSAKKTALIAGETTNLSFTLSESSTTFAASDISVVGGTLSNFLGSGTNYTALFTPTPNSITNGSVSVASGVFTDLAGNTNADGLDTNNKILFDLSGNKGWTRLLGSSGDDHGYSLTTGLDGSIYISGYTTGSLDGQANSGGEDGFVTKYSPDGVKVWTRLIGSKGDDRVWSLTIGLDGSIYLSGETTGSLDGQSNSGGIDGFVAKYSPEGVKLWTRQIGSSKDDYSGDLTTGLDGFIYVSGGTAGSLDGKINSGGLDAFLTKYNPDGSKVWTQWLETSGDDIAGSITTGIDGSVYLAGQTRVITDGKTSFDDYDAFVTKYSPEGLKLWTRSIATDRGDQAWALTTGLDGSIFVSGFTYGSIDGQTNSGESDGGGVLNFV
jgi:uncharacterized delta-60 repeat protein